MHNNPFDENPWTGQNNGPRFGNAYEDDSNNAWSNSGPDPAMTGRMPSPSDYRPPISHHNNSAWSESNKTEYPAGHDEPQNAWSQPDDRSNTATPTNAYQYAGTRFGNQDSDPGNAYSKVQVDGNTAAAPSPTAAGNNKPKPNAAEVEGALPPVWDKSRMNPSKLRLAFRFLQLIASVGQLGFAAGASPFSQQDVPFDNPACFYYLYAVAILTIIWAIFHIFLYLYRRVGHGHKMNRVLMTGIDLLLAILWGIGAIVEIVKYRCAPGGYNHWCDFYNVSIFWAMLAFVLFIVAVVWDVVGACVARRK